jgi:hypothetical protein
VDDRHFGYNTELPTKDTASRTLSVRRAENRWDQWCMQCFGDAQGTSFCCIGTENGNDGGVRKLEEL